MMDTVGRRGIKINFNSNFISVFKMCAEFWMRDNDTVGKGNVAPDVGETPKVGILPCQQCVGLCVTVSLCRDLGISSTPDVFLQPHCRY
ncbi:hypothetical protein E2C01_082647 [Portunus trituberculatus]|uniref:Uncharacterized protein n=1 Tax=Portunus trituberculatus TaxID=210409 RepID=A0A5B7J5Q1_PORTR|nr:hypothetical protein [Portunus trituberculatus]